MTLRARDRGITALCMIPRCGISSLDGEVRRDRDRREEDVRKGSERCAYANLIKPPVRNSTLKNIISQCK